MRATVVALLVGATAAGAGALRTSERPGATLEAHGRLDWFQQAKFGLFIHWGLYAVPAGEWGERTDHGEWIQLQADIPARDYESLAARFNPTAFDADEWAALAKDAGMRYLVITAKHHDGFSMFDSKLTDYDVVDATPFGRDPLKELADASRKAGIKFCAYYSIVDWRHPDFPARYSQVRKQFPDGYHAAPRPGAEIAKYNEFMRGQVRELLTSYGEVGILWFDGGGSFRNRDRQALLEGEALVSLIRELQPAALINNRLGFAADYGTPEQYIPEGSPGTPFEVCMTLNRHWGYNKHDHDWKSPKTIVQNLVDIASKGGNYLLNVGPTAEGRIPEESVKILREVGRWLRVNGDAIYGTTAGPERDKMRVGGGRMTLKPGTLFLSILDWPPDRKVFVEGMKGRLVRRAYLLADEQRRPLRYDAHERALVIHVPEQASDPYASVIVVEFSQDEPLTEG